mgnify:CR=1 FL=1
MEIENFKKLNFNNLLICLLFSLVIFYLFKNFHFFNNFLGQINLVEEGINPKPETCYDFFCRAAIIPYLYYLLLNFLKLDVLIFFQIFLLIFSSFLIRINLINLKLNPLISNILFFIIVFNPKILKYSFGTQEESFFIPALLFGISTIFNFFLRKNIKNLIYLNLAFALIVLIRESGIIFYFLLVIINIYYLVKIDLSILQMLISYSKETPITNQLLPMTTECPICADTYNKSTRAKVTCPWEDCQHECCKNCVRMYLTSTTKDPCCMNCSKP